jgi:hypothetical protein
VQNGFTANGLTEEGYDATVVNTLLVGSGLTVALVASFAIIHAGTQALRASSSNALREAVEEITTEETEEVTAISTQKIIL